MRFDEEHVLSFVRNIRGVRDCAASTAETYEREVRWLADWLEPRALTLIHATPDSIVAYKTALSGRRKPAGAALALASIRSFYNHLVASGALAVSPVPADLRVRKKAQEPACVPTAEQYLAMRERLHVVGGTGRGAIPLDTRVAIIELMAGSGLRIAAMLSLKRRHLRFGSRPIIMVEADSMSCKGHLAGEVPITPYAADIMGKWIAAHNPAPDAPLFDVSDAMVRKVLRQIEPPDLHLKPHSLRHFYCSMAYYRNMDGGTKDAVWVRDAAGHSSIAVTDRYLKMARRVCQSDALWFAWAEGRSVA